MPHVASLDGGVLGIGRIGDGLDQDCLMDDMDGDVECTTCDLVNEPALLKSVCKACVPSRSILQIRSMWF